MIINKLLDETEIFMNGWVKRFEEIMAIPRPSGKEEQIADYLCKFARKISVFFIYFY